MDPEVYTSARTAAASRCHAGGASRGFADAPRTLRARPVQVRGVGLPTSDAEMEAIVEFRQGGTQGALQASRAPATVRANARKSPTRPRPPPRLPPRPSSHAPRSSRREPRRRGDARGGRVSPARREAIASACRDLPSTTTRGDGGIVACAPPRTPTVKSTSGPRTASGSARTPRRTRQCVLARDGGECLVEGLTNNLFVVVKGPGGKPLVRTAPEGSVCPVSRAAVLAAARRRNRGEARAPEAAERKSGKRPVTNAVRLARPIREVMAARGAWTSLGARRTSRWAGAVVESRNARDRSRSVYSSGWWRRRRGPGPRE